jgi:hypothetical protein
VTVHVRARSAYTPPALAIELAGSAPLRRSPEPASSLDGSEVRARSAYTPPALAIELAGSAPLRRWPDLAIEAVPAMISGCDDRL